MAPDSHPPALEDLRGDPEVVLAAVKENWEALQLALEYLKLEEYCWTLERADEEVVLSSIVNDGRRHNGSSVLFSLPALRGNPMHKKDYGLDRIEHI